MWHVRVHQITWRQCVFSSITRQPQGNYRREVDYISMAAVLLDPEALGNQTLLDPAFQQGYYEDTDLAFR